VCARETDIVACIEKMAAFPSVRVYSGHLFYFICASLTIQGFNSGRTPRVGYVTSLVLRYRMARVGSARVGSGWLGSARLNDGAAPVELDYVNLV